MLASALTILWFYTGGSKYFNAHDFRIALNKQPIPEWLKVDVLKYLPWTEFAVGLLLWFKRTWFIGFSLSLVLMTAFTFYVAAGLAHLFKYMPCSCGGIFNHMDWDTHLIVNIGFLLISLAGTILTWPWKRTRTQRTADMGQAQYA